MHFDSAWTEMRVLGNSVVQTPDCSFLSSGNRELRISYGIHTVLRKSTRHPCVRNVQAIISSVNRRTSILSCGLTMMALLAVALVMGVGGLTGRGR